MRTHGDKKSIFLLLCIFCAAFPPDRHACLFAFRLQHIHDPRGAVIAEELAQFFLMICNTVLFDEGDKIRLSILTQRGFAEMRIFRDKFFRSGKQVGEITAPAAGDQDFLAAFSRLFKQQNPTSAFSGLDGAHHARGARTNDRYVKIMRIRLRHSTTLLKGYRERF